MTFSETYKQQLQQIISLNSQQSMLSKVEGFAIYSDRLTCLIGPSGSGKTTLLKQILTVVPAEVELLYKDCSQESWYRDLLSELGISGSAARHSFQFGIGQIEPKKDLLLLLDNAEALSLEQIERLADKVKEDNFHCLMAIDEASPLSEWFIDEHQRVVPLNMELLSEEECVHLLAHCLNLEEGQLLALYDEKALDNIIIQSKGLPGNIVTQAYKLDNRVAPPGDNLDVKSILKYSLITLFVIALALVLLFQEEINQAITYEPVGEHLVSDTSEIKSKHSENNKKDEEHIEEHIEEQKVDYIFLKPDSEVATKKVNKDIVKGTVTESHSAASLETKSGIESKEPLGSKELSDELPKDDLLEEQKQEKQQDSGDEKGIVDDGETLQNSETNQPESTVKETVEHEVTKAAAEPIDGALPIQPESSVEPSAAIPSSSKAKAHQQTGNKNESDSNNSQLKQSKSRFNGQENYLLSLPDYYYFIQLAGFSSLENVSNFLEKHKDQGALSFYRAIREGSTWYVVVMGPYKQRSAAYTARANLSDELKKGGPWIKSSGSIQNAIRQLP